MSELILHHHDPSPFGEKIRLALGLKQLAWRSVQVPMVMPRPEMTALTGGYRRIPVLQVGADVYCDTALIARELERRHPEPTLFPGRSPAGGGGLALALGAWSDGRFFAAGASLAMSIADVPDEVIQDRRAFFTHLDFDRFAEDGPQLHAQLAGHAQLIDDELARGAPFLAGEQPGWVDILAWFPVWMAYGYVAQAGEAFAGLEHLAGWSARMRELDHGPRSELTAGEALAAARNAQPASPADVSDPFSGFRAGDRVAVTPDDYGRDPVVGDLVVSNRHEIAVRRSHAETGDVVVHFPRVGFRLDAAPAAA